MELKGESYCLDCKKPVEVIISWIGRPPHCKECGSPRIMNLKQTNPEDLEKLVKKFKEQTDSM